MWLRAVELLSHTPELQVDRLKNKTSGPSPPQWTHCVLRGCRCNKTRRSERQGERSLAFKLPLLAQCKQLRHTHLSYDVPSLHCFRITTFSTDSNICGRQGLIVGVFCSRKKKKQILARTWHRANMKPLPVSKNLNTVAIKLRCTSWGVLFNIQHDLF